MSDVTQARRFGRNPNDKRLDKDTLALTNLVSAWGKTSWGTATYGNSMVLSVQKVASGDPKFADMYFRKIGQFYGNATPNPTEEDNKAHVEVQSIERTLRLEKAQMSHQIASQNQQSELAQVFKKRGVGGGQNT